MSREELKKEVGKLEGWKHVEGEGRKLILKVLYMKEIDEQKLVE